MKAKQPILTILRTKFTDAKFVATILAICMAGALVLAVAQLMAETYKLNH
jgi:general stress protein CsbA